MNISLNVSDGLVTMGSGPSTWYTGHTGHCHTCLHQSWHFIREDIGPRQIADLLLVWGYHTDLEEKYCKPQITMTTDRLLCSSSNTEQDTITDSTLYNCLISRHFRNAYIYILKNTLNTFANILFWSRWILISFDFQESLGDHYPKNILFTFLLISRRIM